MEDGAEPVDAADALVKAEAAKGLDEDEEVWNEQSEHVSQTYSWQDKYRPRKPRYFNKVITGFEWNKYNQTHYEYVALPCLARCKCFRAEFTVHCSIDNPPPKVVQAYRFTIFCPDLVDPTKAPTYKIIKEPGNQDTCILQFKIGPPYEDLAFRIVNKEWEYSHKKGFKSTFDRGVLQLHFNFKYVLHNSLDHVGTSLTYSASQTSLLSQVNISHAVPSASRARAMRVVKCRYLPLRAGLRNIRSEDHSLAECVKAQPETARAEITKLTLL